ncbi:MAG: MFS transporter [Chloroflexi bacterium]|nr:MFS transporter [Chloroflexota bacterium]
MNGDSPSSNGADVPSGRSASNLPLTQRPTSAPPAPNESSRRPEPNSTEAAASPPKAGTWRYTFSSLSNPDFRFLWFSLLLLMGGMQMQMIARGYLTYELTASPFLLGLVNAGFALPMLGLALFGGAIADRMERKRVIQLGQVGAGFIALFVAVAISMGVVSWYHLLLASMFQGVVFSFLMPARQAIIPQLVGQENLTNAMALNAAAMSATTLIAPTVAGTLYAWIGPAEVYYLIAAFGFGSVVLTGFIRKIDGGPARPAAPMVSDIKAGLIYIRGSPIVLVLLLMGLATALLAMPFRFLMPVFIVDIYGRGPEALGLMVSVMGAGSLAGSMFIASLGRWRRGLLLIVGSFLSGIALLMVALVPMYFVAVGIMVILGLGDAGRQTLNQALIMEEVEDQYRGRVMSVFMMNFGLMPLGVLPTGVAAQVLGAQWAIGILAVLLLAFTAIILITQRRLRQMA